MSNNRVSEGIILALLSVLVVLATLWVAPHASTAIVRSAVSSHRSEKNIPLLISYRTDARLTQDGFFTGAVTAVAETPDPNAVITSALDGAPAVEGNQVLLTPPGWHSIQWQVCKGEHCEDPEFQALKIADMSVLPLRYNAHLRRWSFTGRVMDVQEVNPLGLKGHAAKVQSRHFAAWVLLDLDGVQVARITPAIGDLVGVSLAGAHVSETGVDWRKCDDDSLRRLGNLVDTSESVLLDSGQQITPSNLLIGSTSVSPHRNDALLWTLDVVPEPENLIIGKPLDGDFNGNDDGWYRSEVVLAYITVNGQARMFSRLDDGDDLETIPAKPSNTAMQAIIGDGEHQIVWSLDTGGSLLQRVFIDATPPEITFDADNLSRLTENTSLHGVASDPYSGVREVQFSLDGGKTWEIHPTLPNTPHAPKFYWEFAVHVDDLSEGEYVVRARALDYAGNMSPVAVWNVTVLKAVD